MIITEIIGLPDTNFAYLSRMPDQFLTDKEKEKPYYIKNSMDFFANIAFNQYRNHTKSFVKNYDLLKGILDYSDFYQDTPEVKGFIDVLNSDTELPKYVKHYPILNPPVNTMIGELSKRPDITKVRAFDADSKNEELEYKSNVIEQMIMQEGKKTLMADLQLKGMDVGDVSDEDLNKMVLEKVNEYLTSFTSLGEKWGNNILTALKVEFNLKEISEDCFRDLLIASREFFFIEEDTSKTGFSVENLNPKNQWQLGTPDSKYTSAISGEKNVPYVTGTIHIMELTEMIKRFPDLTTEEIDHLRKQNWNDKLMNGRTNLSNNTTAPDNIMYDTYSRLLNQERALLESEMESGQNRDEFSELLGQTNSNLSYGNKFIVIRAFWESKKKVGLLKYVDEDGQPQEMMVDENYKTGSPNEISIEWGWMNVMYYGARLGPDVFHMKPFKLLDYSPIIGVIHEVKNSTARSLVDLMKPFQVLYNVCLNQLYELLQKEKGKVQLMSIRHVPTPKDGDAQDALDVWEQDAKDRGIVFVDDSLENTKGASSFNQYTALDLTRTQEIQSRYSLASQLKQECWELIGMNRQRLGGALATETATANQNALVQSFAQTEPYFAAHEYVLNQVYQALIDAAQYVEGNKPLSTVRYIADNGEQVFLEVAGSDIKLRDLKVFVTSRSEDQQLLNQFRQLAQPMLQNGASVYDISVLYTTNSLRQMQQIFKDLKEKQSEMQAQQGQLDQSKLQQDGQLKQAELAQDEDQFTRTETLKKYEIDTKANTELAKAQIATYFKAPTTDSDGNGTPDIMDIAGHALKIQETISKADMANKELNFQMTKQMDEVKLRKEDQKIAREKLDNDKKKTAIAAKKPKAK